MSHWVAVLLLVIGIVLFIFGAVQVLTGKVLFGKKANGVYTAASLRHYAHISGRDILIFAFGFITTAIDGVSGISFFKSFGWVMILFGISLTFYSRRVLIKK